MTSSMSTGSNSFLLMHVSLADSPTYSQGIVPKKFKDKAFARGVNREDVVRGADELGIELWEHVAFVLAAMQEDAVKLGLDGSLAT